MHLAFSCGPAAGADRDSGQAERCRAIVRPLLDHFPGLIAGVFSAAGPLWQEGFGSADLSNRRPVFPTTKFRVFSLSKQWTAAAAARLVEAGRLDMHAPIQRYVPAFPEKEWPITAYQLATHTSGIRHYRDQAEADSTRRCGSVGEALSFFKDDPLLFQPGTSQLYSTWGYVLLSAVIEGAAGQPFLEAMATGIFGPRGMTGTVHDDPQRKDAQASVFYRAVENGRFEDIAPINASCKWGGGGFLSTAEDVARFVLGLSEGKLLGPDLTRLILQPDASGDLRSGGLSTGGRSFYLFDPSEGVIAVILGNARGEDADLPGAAAALLKIFKKPGDIRQR